MRAARQTQFFCPKTAIAWLMLTYVFSLGGCRGQHSEEPPIVPIRNMYNQPRYNPQAESQFFADHRAMRPLVAGSIAREMTIHSELALGRTQDDSDYTMVVPEVVSKHFEGISNMLDRGEERYGIYCSPCHGASGNGQGIVVKRGMLQPPSFHDERLRHIPDGQLYATIRNGIGNMPSYRHTMSVYDRWAVVSYVRALQLTHSSEQEPVADQGVSSEQAAEAP